MRRRQTSDVRHQGNTRLLFCLLAAVCGLLTTTGWIRRTLTIRSEPAGAQVMVNDAIVGVTPYSSDFLWYGWYRIILTKPGYEQLDDRVWVKCPWYLWIPMDLAMEVAPFAVRDAKVLSYQLQRSTPLPEPTPPVVEPPPAPPTEERHDDAPAR